MQGSPVHDDDCDDGSYNNSDLSQEHNKLSYFSRATKTQIL